MKITWLEKGNQGYWLLCYVSYNSLGKNLIIYLGCMNIPWTLKCVEVYTGIYKIAYNNQMCNILKNWKLSVLMTSVSLRITVLKTLGKLNCEAVSICAMFWWRLPGSKTVIEGHAAFFEKLNLSVIALYIWTRLWSWK